ncbi:hypothetical protein [Wenyingzhuangia sp. 2_MG-2023]|uniref:hypothetical protein n=1 Tax=Wenyingzhuangia sp. 2_MG-2023 TaxID=3062639 RepID=UPI0026E415D3|nr:hypothetical protein [Wenyingzhuangia sp. 2_MG-2023]MDO6736976.1 hypothetical protein [Wenyingzhuangia sp. 2_MG-2023]
MMNFTKKTLKKENVLKEDTGIKVSDLIKLLGEDSMSIEFLELLNIKSIEDEFINIKGAKTVVEAQKLMNSKFNKIDLLCSLENISLYDQKEFTVNFQKICNNDYSESLGVKNISVWPIYSANRDFFSCLYQMDKYANRLIQNEHSNLVKFNFDYLKNIIVISNDEIKREALRFSAGCSLFFDEKNREGLIMLPSNIKFDILSIKYNQVSKTAMTELNNISEAKNIHDELFDDISKISNIKNPEQIKFVVREKIEKAKRDGVKKIKKYLIRELDKTRIRNVIDFLLKFSLLMFKRIELLDEENIEAIDYLRFIMYQALVLIK